MTVAEYFSLGLGIPRSGPMEAIGYHSIDALSREIYSKDHATCLSNLVVEVGEVPNYQSHYRYSLGKDPLLLSLAQVTQTQIHSLWGGSRQEIL